MTAIAIDGLTVRKGGDAVVHDIGLRVGSGRVLALLGSSGSGKTTLLRALAGLESVAGGTVAFDDRDVTESEPRARNVAFVFQQPVLFPKTVQRNIAFPLEVDHQPVDEIRKRVGAEARALHIEDLLLRRPDQLSAGEAQVVQIARALVKQPAVLLLDEPFARVDAHQTAQLRREVMLIQRGFGVTTVIAANEPADAMTMGDEIAVIEDGRLVQCDVPLEVYGHPRTVDAALLTGSADVIEVEVTGAGAGSWLVRDGLRIRAWAPALEPYRGRRLQMVVRPEWWQLDPNGVIDADVVRIDLAGRPMSMRCTVGGRPMTVTVPPSATVDVGDHIRLRLARFTLIDPRTGYRIAAIVS
jgi:ABC-type sugar transport system ATPase subunit